MPERRPASTSPADAACSGLVHRAGRGLHPGPTGTAPGMSLHPDEPNEGPLIEPGQDPVPPGEDPADDPSPEPDLV